MSPSCFFQEPYYESFFPLLPPLGSVFFLPFVRAQFLTVFFTCASSSTHTTSFLFVRRRLFSFRIIIPPPSLRIPIKFVIMQKACWVVPHHRFLSFLPYEEFLPSFFSFSLISTPPYAQVFLEVTKLPLTSLFPSCLPDSCFVFSSPPIQVFLAVTPFPHGKSLNQIAFSFNSKQEFFISIRFHSAPDYSARLSPVNPSDCIKLSSLCSPPLFPFCCFRSHSN